LVKFFEKVTRVAVDCNAARRAQRLLGKAAAQNADGGEPLVTRSFGVVGRITDHNSFPRIPKAELVEGRLEDVGTRLRAFRIIGRGCVADEIGIPAMPL
jgi:hypothetical protein